MQKSMWFSMGLMGGLIAVLLTIVVFQNREPMAHAQAAGVAGEGEVMMYSGGSQPQIEDIIWVLHRKNTPRKPGTDPNDLIGNKTERLILACYQVRQQGRGMKLVGVRDISFDLDIPEYMNEKPTVRDIITELKKVKAADSRNKRR